ncbi:MAG TPA: hypothetical protein VFA77_02645, partial [Candidatus Eisenbacteria bacterium]|nr:hypothetical protein [Candidatus Eisenbacteria bacterium]
MAGRYSNAVLYPFNGSAPGLDVFGYGRGCGSVCGDFQVLEIQTNAAAQVAHFWVTFSLHCNCGAPTFSGDIRYNSLVAPPAALPRKLRVPADFPTIQAAINDANVLVADTVFVAPGTYFEYIDFRGKALTVVSEKGPEATIIDGKNSGSIITFGSHEGRDSVLCGFTIQNGVQNVYAGGGGAITVGFSSPTIVSNVFRNNQQGFGIGAAIGCNGSSPLIAHNLFMNNNGYDLDSGGGVISFINASSPLIANNVFEHN